MLVGGTPAVFGGTIENGDNEQAIQLLVDTPFYSSGSYNPPGFLFTLAGSISSSGGATFDGVVQVGDGKTNGSISGPVFFTGYTYAGGAPFTEMVFDVANGATEAFDAQNTVGPGGSAAIVKTGDGTLQLNGPNYYNGITRVEDGTLRLESTTALPLGTEVIVDRGTDSTATLDLNGYSNENAVFSVTLNGGRIEDSTHSGAALDVAGLIELFSGAISANLTGTATLLKSYGTGSDTAVLSGNNSYAGETTVLDGILSIETASALGTMSAGMVVENGATLQLQAAAGTTGFAVAAASALFLAGDGVLSNGQNLGALDNLSGDNYWSGPIVLDNGTSDTEINSDAGTLFLTQGIDGASSGSPLTFGGAGNITIAGVGIGANVGDVTKDGSGTLTLAADGSYTGVTTIYAGRVLDYGNGIPSGANVVSDGGTLVLEFGVYSGPATTLPSIDVDYGATLDLGGNDVTVTGPVILADGNLMDGTVSAGSYLLTSGTVGAVLAGSGDRHRGRCARGHRCP